MSLDSECIFKNFFLHSGFKILQTIYKTIKISFINVFKLIHLLADTVLCEIWFDILCSSYECGGKYLFKVWEKIPMEENHFLP